MKLTTEQIHALEVGPETDALVATEVMGWVRHLGWEEAWIDPTKKIKQGPTIYSWNPSKCPTAAAEAMATVREVSRGLVAAALRKVLLHDRHATCDQYLIYATPLQQCKALLLLAMERTES